MIKFKSRAEMVINQVAPPPAAILAWNSLAVACLGYWPQLLLPPPIAPNEELRWLNKLLRLPGSCCSLSFFARMGEVGVNPPLTYVAWSLATLARVVAVTLREGLREHQRLLHLGSEWCQLLRLWRGCPWPLHWSWDCMASTLAAAIEAK